MRVCTASVSFSSHSGTRSRIGSRRMTSRLSSSSTFGRCSASDRCDFVKCVRAIKRDSVTPTRTNDSIVLGVPGSDARVQAVLEASCDSGRRFDEHDLEVLTAVAQIGGLVMEISRCRAPARARSPVSVAPLIGSTSVMHALRERVERVAATDFTVLVEGESGTGKELVARQVHELSRRRNGPFVAVNCAAVVETLLEAELFGIEERTATGVRGRRGKFEHADGGTLFLDEVSDLSLSAQAKLLRVIQDVAVERVGGQGSARQHAHRRRDEPPPIRAGRAQDCFARTCITG